MILILHILSALGSLLAVALVNLNPSPRKLIATYILTSILIGTGSYLLVYNSSHLMESCVAGLLVLGAISKGLFSAKRKLATFKSIK